MTPHTRTLALDGCIGLIAGFLILHPISMAIVSSGPGTVSFDPANLHRIMLHPMGIYFAFIGLAAGLLSGYFRGRLALQNSLLASALTERENLLRILGHDLSNTILAASAVLKIKRLHPENQDELPDEDFIGEAEACLVQAQEIIDSTRMLLGIESGKLDVPLALHDVRPIIQDAVKPFLQSSQAKDLQIHIVFATEPLLAMVEPTIFRSTALGNLISNAVKFAFPGTQIDINAYRDGDNIKVDVTNEGPCLDADRCEDLFSPCSVTSTPGTKGEKGTGFGLPLVQRLLERMHGRVVYLSTPLKEGNEVCRTTFSILLPHAD